MEQPSPFPNHLQVLQITPSDIPSISDIHLRAWLTNTLYATIYHTGYTSALLAANIDRHTNALLNDATTRYLKCVLTTPTSPNGETIAWAKLNVFPTASAVTTRKDTSERTWPPGINLALVELFWGKLQALRARYGPRLGPHVQVDLVATDPQYFRKGAGKALMQAVVDVADEEALPCFLEGSPEAERLYASVGFVDVGEFWVDLGRFEGGGDKGLGWRESMRDGGRSAAAAEPVDGETGWYRQVVMIRPARGKSVADYLGKGWEGGGERMRFERVA